MAELRKIERKVVNPFIEEFENGILEVPMIVLYKTLPLADLPSDFRDALQLLYNSVDPVRRILASVLNSLYTQNRFVFGLTRGKLAELIKNDINQRNIDFSVPHYYTQFLYLLLNSYAYIYFPAHNKRQVIGYMLKKGALMDLIASNCLVNMKQQIEDQKAEFSDTFRSK